MEWWERVKKFVRRLSLAEEESGAQLIHMRSLGGHPMDRYAAPSSAGIMDRLKQPIRPTQEQKNILVLITVMLVLVLVINQISLLSLVFYPFAIINTIFHEFGHAAMCLLTGGRMGSIEIQMNEAGATRFSGGWPCLILPAGYIGSTAMGAVLLFTGFGHRTSRYAVERQFIF